MRRLATLLTVTLALASLNIPVANANDSEANNTPSIKPLGVGVSFGLIDIEIATGIKVSKGLLSWWEIEVNGQRTGLALNKALIERSPDEIPSTIIGLDSKFYLGSSFYILGGAARNIPTGHRDGYLKAPPTNRYHIAIGNKWDLNSKVFLDARWVGVYHGAGSDNFGGWPISELLNLGIGCYFN